MVYIVGPGIWLNAKEYAFQVASLCQIEPWKTKIIITTTKTKKFFMDI